MNLSFANATLLEDQAIACTECPKYGMKCDGTGVWGELQAEDGWWLETNPEGPIVMFRCLDSSHCLGGNKCAENREGPACSLCVEGTRSRTGISPCEACPERSSTVSTTVFYAFVAFAVFVFLYYLVLKSTKGLSAHLKRTGETPTASHYT